MSQSTGTFSPDGLTKNIPSSSGSSNIRRQREKPTEINAGIDISSIAFLVDGKHILGGDRQGKIRSWRVTDGMEVGIPMDAGGPILGIALSRDGKWVVSGTRNGSVTVWDAESHERMMQFIAHGGKRVRVLDVSPDATKIATGSNDKTVCVWSFWTGGRLLGPLKHDKKLAAVKFSPDGRLIATAQWGCDSVQVFDSENGRLLVKFPIRVNSAQNQSLAWADDSKKLFVLSETGIISYLDVLEKATLFRWHIHTSVHARYGTLARNRSFITASANSSVSFWDSITHKQIGTIVRHAGDVKSMAISCEYELATYGGRTITLRSLHDILPFPYCDDAAIADWEIRGTNAEETRLEETDRQFLHEGSSSEVTYLEQTIQELRDELSRSRHAADQEKTIMSAIIRSLRADLHTERTNSVNLEKNVQKLHGQLSKSRSASNQGAYDIEDTPESPPSREGSSNGTITQLKDTIEELYLKLGDSQHKASSLLRVIRTHEQKRRRESLFAQGDLNDTAGSLLEIANTVSKDLKANKLTIDWLSEFMQKCVVAMKRTGDEALNTDTPDEGPTTE